MLEAEVHEFLHRLRYVRSSEFRGDRNGHKPSRKIGTGMGAVAVRLPRLDRLPHEAQASSAETGRQ